VTAVAPAVVTLADQTIVPLSGPPGNVTSPLLANVAPVIVTEDVIVENVVAPGNPITPQTTIVLLSRTGDGKVSVLAVEYATELSVGVA
jgi:hypothetical protein